MKYWVIKFTPLFTSAKVKILDLPAGSIVESTGRESEGLSEVSFITRQKTYLGWVHTSYLEELVYQFKESTVFTQQTDYPYDSAQYIVWEGSTLFNLCGEACIAYIYGDTVESLLSVWKATPASLYNKIIYGGLSKTTGIGDLIDMVKIYNGNTVGLNAMIYDPISKHPLVSPDRIAKLLINFNLIVGCKISGTSGELKASGIPHWIVLNKVVQDGVNRGWVEIWNPFSGRKELYSWREFIASTYPMYGLLVERRYYELDF
jgi:hypothetical protein